MSLSLSDISLCGQSTNDGRLDITPDHVIWTPRSSSGDSAGKKSLDLRKLATAHWCDVGRSCQLFLRDKEGTLYRFEGFKSTDDDAISNALLGSKAAIKLERMKLGAKGGNWGDWEVNGKQLEWREIVIDDETGEASHGKLIASIPLESISQAQTLAKGDIDIQFIEDDLAEKEDELLVEMRLHVPRGHKILGERNRTQAEEALKKKTAAKKKAAASNAMDEDGAEGGAAGEDGEDGAEAVDSADGFVSAHQLSALISEAAGVAGVTGDAIVEFPDTTVGQFLVPRGRYAIEMYPQFCRLVGKTYEFKVAYKSIARMFYLPRPPAGGSGSDVTRYMFVISLDDPLKIGAQRHPHLILQMDRQPASFPVNVSDEDIAAGKFDGLGASSKTVEGDLPKVVAMLFKQITGKPIFKPGAFVSAAGGKSQAVRCTCKSNDGLLFPLEKSLVFVHKPAIWLRYTDIDGVELRKAASSSSSFELALSLKSGSLGGFGSELSFQALDKSEWQPLKTYFEERGLKVKEAAHGGAKINYAEMDLGTDEDEDDDDASNRTDDEDEDSEDDDDYNGEEDSDDDDDGKKKKSKKGKKEDKSGKKRKRSKDSDASSADDDDDDDDSDASDDEDEGFKKKKKGKKAPAKKKPAKKKARKGSDDDSD